MDTKVTTGELLKLSLQRYSYADLAYKLDVTTKTIRNWELKEDGPPKYQNIPLQSLLFGNKQPSDEPFDFTFIDLFAGIGGIRMGFEAHGGQCVFTSERDKYALKTYCENFSTNHPFNNDITQVNVNEIPDHDLLLAGFPCQPFSIAGVSKKQSLGRAHGFEDKTQGTLFFDVARIIKQKQPKAFLLENVKNLKSHDKGKTFQIIKDTLENELGYKIYTKIIDAKGFVPQHRERIYIVGFKEDTEFTWDAFKAEEKTSKIMSDILHSQNGTEQNENEYTQGIKSTVNPKYILSDKLWTFLYNYAAKHKAKGNGFGYGMVTQEDTSRTLSARYYKDGSEILINRGQENPRRLTPRECARIMGFPDSYTIPVSDTQAYKQFGNSVVMPVIKEIAHIMKPHILTLIEENKSQIHQSGLAL